MSKKHVVVQGAICNCTFGLVPDILKVYSQSSEYANDHSGSQKLIATTLETGQPFQNKTFGLCKLQPMGATFKPCQPMLTVWKGYYEALLLKNGGYMILEDSQAVCAISGSPCIKIMNHGQTAELSGQNIKNACTETHAQLNPLVKMDNR